MSLSCPVLNDIMLEEISKLKNTIYNLESNTDNSINLGTVSVLSQKYEIQEKEINRIKNTLRIYKSEQLNNAILGEKLDSIIKNTTTLKIKDNDDRISKLEDIISISNKTINNLLVNLKPNNILAEKPNIFIDNDMIKNIVYESLNEKLQIFEKKIEDLSNNTLKLNIELNKLNTNIANLDKRIEIVEKKQNYKKTYHRTNHYQNYKDNTNYYNKNYDNKNSNMLNTDSNSTNDNKNEGWVKVTNRKRNKKF